MCVLGLPKVVYPVSLFGIDIGSEGLCNGFDGTFGTAICLLVKGCRWHEVNVESFVEFSKEIEDKLGVMGVLAMTVGIKNNSTIEDESRKIFQPKNNRISSLRFRGRVAILLTNNATETGNTRWLWLSCRKPIHPHLWLYPLCLLPHHRS